MQHSPSASTKAKDSARLKEFGEVMALACFIFSAVSLYRHSGFSTVNTILLTLGSLFLILGLFLPNTLAKPEQLWMAFAERLSIVMTFVVMFITFFTVVTPIGLTLRLFGKDLLGKRFDKSRKTYWEPMESDGPGSRHHLPY